MERLFAIGISQRGLMQVPRLVERSKLIDARFLILDIEFVESKSDGRGNLNFSDQETGATIGFDGVSLRFEHYSRMTHVVTDAKVATDGRLRPLSE